MSTKYPQGVITATPPFQSTTAQSFSGVWTLEQLGKNYFYYQQPVAKSLRFRSSASAYLNRTPSTGGNRTTWTWSGWVKRGALGAAQVLFGAASSPNGSYFRFESSDALRFYDYNGVTFSPDLITTQVFRDPSAWYHVVLVSDTTNATAADRVRLYVNGTQVTAFSTATYPAQNANNTSINNTYPTTIGAASATIDGYLAEVNFIDGQALDPSYFGQLSTITGVWSPKKYVGSYGTNGFYLPFTNATSTTTLGYDSSGNSNNWTTNNISLTSGVTYDSMWDSPTSYDNGVNGVGNYAVLNPLMRSPLDQYTPTNGNLSVNLVTNGQAISSIPVSSGKWYFESVVSSGTIGTDTRVGFQPPTAYSSYFCGNASSLGYAYGADGNKAYNGSFVAYGNTWGVGDVVGTALDLDNGKVYWSKNGVWQASGDPVAGTNAAYTGISGTFCFVLVNGNSATNNKVFNANFGQRPFAYTPPTGFKALNTQNLPAVSIANGANHMAATTYTGNGGTQSIINAANSVSFKPDFVWMKSRSNLQSNYLVDSVRGGSSLLRSDTAGAESTGSVWIQSFDASGFTATNNILSNGYTYVGWQWKAGGTAVTNTAGSITSSVSANPTAGFSVVTYTGTGANATVGHGLGVAPSMIIVKNRTTAATSWITYHSALLNTQALYLNTTDAVQTSNLFWNNTSPTSSVFSVAAYNPTNQSTANIVAYCFAAIPGYSAFGSYTGNGSTDGPFVYCGFRPRWILIKNAGAAGDWTIMDTSRDTYNAMITALYPNLSVSEGGGNVDALSNGFKVRNTTYQNGSGNTMIYAAFAENPFKYSLAR